MNFYEKLGEKSVQECLCEKIKKTGWPFYIFGAGAVARGMGEMLEANEMNVIGVCDNNTGLVGTSIKIGQKSFTICRPDEMEKIAKTKNYYVINTVDEAHHYSVMFQLVQLGVVAENIISRGLLECKGFNKPINIQEIKENEIKQTVIRNCDSIEKVLSLLADEKSKEIYKEMIRHLYWGYRGQVSSEYVCFPEYFQEDVIPVTEEEVFVDLGVYHGETTRDFIRYVKGNYKKIIGIEADEANYNMAKKQLADVKNLELYHCCFHSEDTVLSFDGRGATDSRLSNNGNVKVKAIKGDNMKIPATYIKMDIEGAEPMALEGLRQTIQEYKPKLAVCIYHSLEQFWTLPLQVHEMVPEYKLYIRNHSIYQDETETVCYAVL